MKHLVLLSTTLLALLTIISTMAVGNEWEDIPPSEAKIVFDAPGLIGGGQFKTQSKNYYSEQIGIWFSGPFYPRAVVYLQELYPNSVRRDRIRLVHALKFLLKDKELDIAANQEAVNVLGRVEYGRFIVEKLHCVGFGQHFGVGGTWDNDRGIPPHFITGYYCDTKPLTDDIVEAAIQALGVRGYNTPSEATMQKAPTADESTECIKRNYCN
jgi:hypothetical protein